MADTFNPGDHYVIDDRTGFKIKRSQARKEWNNRIVRRESFEERHPQDFLRSRKDDQTVVDPRPEATDTFLTPNEAYNALSDTDVTEASASAAAGGGNTGNGTFSGLTADLSADSSYTLTVTKTTRTAANDQDVTGYGEFRLVDSGSVEVATGQIGVAFNLAGLSFTLNEGSTAFVVGDSFTITVT